VLVIGRHTRVVPGFQLVKYLLLVHEYPPELLQFCLVAEHLGQQRVRAQLEKGEMTLLEIDAS
jgi:hypothetical protein